MAVNTTPVYPITAQNEWTTVLTTANNVYDGSGTQVTVVTGSTYGTRIDEIRLLALGTNVATVMRFFQDNGSTKSLYLEVSLPATTASATTVTTPGGAIIIPVRKLVLKYNVILKVCIGTTVASGWQVIVSGGELGS